MTGGGDCAGIDAVIRAIVKKATNDRHEVIGIRRGWAGLLEPDTLRLTYESVSESIATGGTLLLTSRTNPFKRENGPELVMKTVSSLGLDAVIAIGGEDTLGVAHRLTEYGLKAIGVPKTIDNDLSETDLTFGFDSAVNVAVEAIDRIRTTGMSHERVMVVEVMGRDAGWVATYAGIAGGAHCILVPEEQTDLASVCEVVMARKKRGQTFTLIVVAEGVQFLSKRNPDAAAQNVDEFGHLELGGVGHVLAGEIERRTGIETRAVVLGHLIRGGAPSAFDRVLSTRLGVAAVEAVEQGRSDVMVALQRNHVVKVGISDAIKPKKLDLELLSLGRMFSP